ncbi:CopL family metal-binding regulatory protein [Pseudolysobacter antarcticus]|uniref:CopL family metal-binding regulatory protein n=1 Tax=Pseudolysobacter antarcticus TaxID=2511995 RepID=UPI0013EC0BD9
MVFPFARTKSVRILLCCLLAFVLVLNGALAPIMAQTMLDSGADVSQPTSHTHCHEKNASAASKSVDADSECPCCDGSSCDCSCISVASIPVLFLNLPPLPPVAFATQWTVPPAPVSPAGRLLRPPIA